MGKNKNIAKVTERRQLLSLFNQMRYGRSRKKKVSLDEINKSRNMTSHWVKVQKEENTLGGLFKKNQLSYKCVTPGSLRF